MEENNYASEAAFLQVFGSVWAWTQAGKGRTIQIL